MKNNIQSLAEGGIFAILIVQKEDGEVLLHPTGMNHNPNICEAVEEFARQYPNCKMKLYEASCINSFLTSSQRIGGDESEIHTNQENFMENNIQSLAEGGTFALIIFQKEDGEVLLQPIGMKHNPNISETAEELARQYPNCKMRLYEENYGACKGYFRGIIDNDHYLW